VELSRCLRKCVGNGALAWPDLDDDVVLGSIDGAQYRIDNAGINEEVLAESFARTVTRHQLAASFAASSTAAIRLPGSALPVPAMSKAVP
jgi:hypothetical protein